MLRFIFESSIALGISATILWITPLALQGYIIVGIIMAVVGLLATYQLHGLLDNDEHAPTPTWLAWTIAIWILLGALWPALLLALLYLRLVRRLAPTWASKRRWPLEPSKPSVPSIENSQENKDRHHTTSDPRSDPGLLRRNSH